MPDTTFEANSADNQSEQQHDGQDQAQGAESHINVGQAERLASVVGGSLLTLIGMRRRSNLGALLMLAGGGLIYRGVSGYCHISALLGRDTAHGEPAAPEEYFERGVHVEQSVTVDRSPEELYTFWRNFENLPRFMDHLESVKVTDDKKSHWVAKAPAGYHVEWDAEIINDEPNKTIAWRSLGGADVDNAGSVRFIPGQEGKGTEVRVVFDYLPPAGQVGRWIAKLFGEEPAQQVGEDLRLFKKVMEAGVTSDQSNNH